MATEQLIVVDTSIHELAAVQRLVYSLSDLCSAHLERIDDTHVQVLCRGLGGAALPDDFEATFDNGLIDYGIRIRLNRETSVIRDLIFRQAFVETDL